MSTNATSAYNPGQATIQKPLAYARHPLLVNGWSVIALAILFLAPYVAWSFFVFPVADDFSVVGWNRSATGLWDALIEDYQSGSGLYLSRGLRWLHAPLTLNGHYYITPFIAFAIHLLGGAMAFRIFLYDRGGWRQAIALGTAWMILYISTMYSASETIYWATGMLVYEPGNVMALILTVVWFVDRRPANIAHFVGVPILVIAMCGSHYPFILWAGSLCLHRSVFSPHRWFWRTLLMIVILRLVFVFCAPGTWARRAAVSDTGVSPDVFVTAVVRSVFSFVTFLGRGLADVRIWLVGAIAAIHCSSTFARHRQKATIIEDIAACVFAIGALYGLFLLSAAGGYDPPPVRTHNAAHYLFVCMAAFIFAPTLDQFAPTITKALKIRMLALVLVGLVFLSPNYILCIRDFLSSAGGYRQHWLDIEARAERSRVAGDERLALPANPKVRPPTVYHPSWLTADPTAWPNPNYARYFGIKEVVAIEDNE